jgi:hypothetical protein
MLDVIDDGYLGIARKDKVTMHRVDGEILQNSSLRGIQALRNYGATIHASCARRMP